MSNPSLAVPHSLADAASRSFSLVTSAWRSVTWEHVLYTFLLCLAWSGIELAAGFKNLFRLGSWSPAWNGFLSMQCNGFVVLFAVLLTEQASPPSLRRWWPYAIAVIAGVALGTTLFWLLSQRVFMLASVPQLRGLPDGFASVFLRHAPDRFVACGLATYVYLWQRLASQRLVALRTVQLERVKAQKRVMESRLAAMQARVEPEFLRGALGEVERLYEVDARAGDRMLKDLTVYLRAAIPQIRDPVSTVAREIRLTNAYLNIVGLRSKDCLHWSPVGPSIGDDARMPPMVMLPLVLHALGARAAGAQSDDPFEIVTAVRDARLSLTIRDHAEGFAPEGADDAAIRQIRERLSALYGEDVRLTLDRTPEGTEATLEIPARLN